jgi:hypothetical protein
MMMNKKTTILELTKAITSMLELKQTMVRRELRRSVTRIVNRRQEEEAEKELAKAVEPVFVRQVEGIARRLKELSGEKTSTDIAHTLVSYVFRPDEWKRELTNVALPIMAIKMTEAFIAQFLTLGVDIRQVKSIRITNNQAKASTATNWVNNHPGDFTELEDLLNDSDLPIHLYTELPEWTKAEIAERLTETFEQPYWDDIHKTTMGDAEKVLRQGLDEGWSISRIANTMGGSFMGHTGKYAKMRATRIARTEVGGALNSIRKASINKLAEDLGPQISVRSNWLSVLGPTTRDSHASLDGVPADAEGLWLLGGVRVPYPRHVSLPPGERINCLCSIFGDFGLEEAQAQQLIQDYYGREESNL